MRTECKKTNKQQKNHHDMEEKVYFSLVNPVPEIDPQTNFLSVWRIRVVKIDYLLQKIHITENLENVEKLQ